MDKELIDKGAISVCIIQQGRLDFMAKIFELADEWGREMELVMLIGNTPNGMYEIIGLPKQSGNG